MGAMLGLEGIEAGRDWRGPVADRMLISSADGGYAINDAVRVSARLVDLGRRLAGLPPSSRPKRARNFTFRTPAACRDSWRLATAPRTSSLGMFPSRGGRALQVRYAGLGDEPAAALTPTFAPPEVTRMRTYELMATPLVYPGETVRARVIADRSNRGSCPGRPARAGLWRERLPRRRSTAEPVALSPGAETVLTWRLPDTGGQPIQSLGLVLRSSGAAADGAVMLDYLRWDGPPDVRLRRPDEPGDFWRRAWVNAVEVFSTTSPQAFRISQDRGEGMIIHGGRQWTDYRVETALTVHLAEHAGIGVRVQGLRRYYAVLLMRPGLVRLVRAFDGVVTILAETPLELSFETPYDVAVEVSGREIEAARWRRRAQGARRKSVRAR